MNKSDIKLIIIILFITIVMLFVYFINKEEADIALVYYDSSIVLTIDLNINNIYEVDGQLGKVKIQVENKQIKVIEENSPYHLCSKQGFIKNKGESIICLPNKVIIELPNDDIDTEVK